MNDSDTTNVPLHLIYKCEWTEMLVISSLLNILCVIFGIVKEEHYSLHIRCWNELYSWSLFVIYWQRETAFTYHFGYFLNRGNNTTCIYPLAASFGVVSSISNIIIKWPTVLIFPASCWSYPWNNVFISHASKTIPFHLHSCWFCFLKENCLELDTSYCHCFHMYLKPFFFYNYCDLLVGLLQKIFVTFFFF
jgi:hypothetical protein